MRKVMALAPAVGRNDVGRIETLCAEALEVDPRDVMALMTLADTFWRNQRHDKALAAALHALEVDSHEFYALRIVADIYAARGEHELAYRHAKRLLNANAPAFPPTKAVSRILTPFAWLAKVRRLKERVIRDEHKTKASYSEWVQWAREYVSWYETSRPAAP